MVRVALFLLAGVGLSALPASASEPVRSGAADGRPAAGITLPRPTHRIVEPKPIARIIVPEARSREVAPEIPGRTRIVPAAATTQPVRPAASPGFQRLPTASGTTERTLVPAAAPMPRMDDPQPAFGPETFAATARAADDYRSIQRRGGWPMLEERTGLASGASGEKVLSLKQLLATQGDLPEQAATDQRYGPETVEAVRRFEFRHGLPQTGMVAGGALAALRVPVQLRQAQLQASARRLGTTRFDFGGRYLVINRAAGELEAVSDGIVVQRFAVRAAPGFDGPSMIVGMIPGIVAGAGGLRVPVSGPVPHALVPARLEAGRTLAAPAEGEVAVLGLPALAAWLLADPDLPDEPTPDVSALMRLVDEAQARPLPLRRPLGIASVYLTGFSGRDGMVRFRPDPLGLDVPGATAQR